jgi:predicted signal transduction protein with EAL and GGDEF domain
LFAETARSVVRDRDHVVRWGGEEFALLLPGANAERAAEVVGRLRIALAQAHLLSGTPVFTASFGISDSTMTRERETLIRLADEALYRSKQAGRDCCTIGDAQLSGTAITGASATKGRWWTSRKLQEGVEGNGVRREEGPRAPTIAPIER